jgi:hypothetical protein
LDGETSVMLRKAAGYTMEYFPTKEAMMDSRGHHDKRTFTVDAPSPSLARWKGHLEHNEWKVPLHLEQFLFRGSVLRNTEAHSRQ